MSFSEAEYLCRTENAEHAADDPADTLRARTLANNIAHLCDQSAQVIANWGVAEGSGIQRTAQAEVAIKPLWESPPFFPRSRPDGTSYPIRIRLRGRQTSGAITTSLWAALEGANEPTESSSAWTVDTISIAGGPAPGNEEFTPTTTTAWMTPTSDGLIQHINTRAACVVDFPTLRALGAGPTSIQVPVSKIVVYMVETNVVNDTVELSGVYAAEYIGL